MRLRLNAEEIGILLGLIGDVDWGAHFECCATPEEGDREFAMAERVKAKLERRYSFLSRESG